MSYSKSYFIIRESWRDWRIEARLLIDLARVTRGARVLEIGCGGGGLLRLLRERGAYAVGIDTLQVALELARTRLSLRAERSNLSIRKSETPALHQTQCGASVASSQRTLLAMTGENPILPFASAPFDAIIGQHVVEHLPDVDAALREWRRVLKPKGRIALATPNALYPDPAHFADADHAQVFAPRELRDAVERAGFVVESCRTIFPFLSRVRVLRAFGVIAYQVFQHAPYFASRGRTILLGARKI